MARRSRHRGDPDERGPRRNVRRRERPHLDLVVGVRPVSEALRAGRREAHKLIWRDGAVRPRPAISALLELAERSGVATEALDPQEFEKRVASVGPTHQGVVLEAGPLPTLRLQEIQEAFAGAELLVALDGVEDPQNLGAIARVAVGAGVDGLVLPKRRSAPISSAVGRASAGAIEYLPVAVVPNLREALTRLKKIGFVVIGADPAGSASLYVNPEDSPGDPSKVVLVLGAEGAGMRPSLLATLDHRIRIPMANSIASLNVSTAAAVILFEWRRRRTAGRGPPKSPGG